MSKWISNIARTTAKVLCAISLLGPMPSSAAGNPLPMNIVRVLTDGTPPQAGLKHIDGTPFTYSDSSRMVFRYLRAKVGLRRAFPMMNETDLHYKAMDMLQEEVNAKEGAQDGAFSRSYKDNKKVSTGSLIHAGEKAVAVVPTVTPTVKPTVKPRAKPTMNPSVKQPTKDELADKIIKPRPKPKKETEPVVEEKKIALWTNSGVQWVTDKMCSPIVFEKAPFMVSDYFSSLDDRQEEVLRSSGFYDVKDPNSNFQSTLPLGSLVSLEGEKTADYQQIKVLTVANHQTNIKALSKIGEEGYIHRNSLGDLQNYSFLFEEKERLRNLKDMGLDLKGYEMSVRLSEKAETQGIDCCTGKECKQFVLFDAAKSGSSGNEEKQIAVSAEMPDFFNGVSAHVPSDMAGENQEQQESPNVIEPSTDISNGTAPTSQPVKKEPLREDAVTLAPGPTTLKPQPTVTGIPVIKGSVETIICSSDETSAFRDLSRKIILRVKRGEKVEKLQSWSKEAKDTVIDGGKTYHFVKVRLPDRGNLIGLASEELIKHPSQCPGLSAPKIEEAKEEAEAPTAMAPEATTTVKTGMTFPLLHRPFLSYTSNGGMRRFGARRKKGKRTHAGTDLYGKHGETLVAVSKARLQLKPFYYYESTCAMDIKLQSGLVVRYGEIKCTKGLTLTPGNGFDKKGNIDINKKVAVMGTVDTCRKNPRLCGPMLHFELYRGSSSGSSSCTPAGRPKYISYSRGPGLCNPTSFVQSLERATFGKSY